MIVVGVDGSDTGLEAAAWAAREAEMRRAPVRVVYAMAEWALEMAEDAPHAEVGRWMRDNAATVLADAVARVKQEAPDVAVESRLLGDDPRLALLEEAKEADLLVVGNHGLGGFRGLLLGSVALGVSGQATCPVAVVRVPPAPPRNVVVVGVDGSPGSLSVIEFAFAEAALRGAELHAVHAWNSSIIGYGPETLAEALEDAATERRLLAEVVAGCGERYPDVKVIERSRHGHPAEVLRLASADAELLVLGSRGRGPMAGLFLGSVSHALLHHGNCPIVVLSTG
ncbi:Nucleotide-binding universal stress protein, UspA family [Sinosporangium album]|uniref:Nucleotide-binding universal stress protein, UspA family n=2 Tax=Sinosporangium album TaxID=504805 RepID=A0A1G7T2A3_9ACTN|nr:Nucleotide-binding universal stress protein, UspA family [Sinosporangium album]